MSSSTMVIVPTRNEAGNMMQLISEYGEHAAYTRLHVVDDSDGPDTINAAIAAARRFHRVHLTCEYRQPSNREGKLVSAVKAGYRCALDEGFDRAIVMDGDGQHDPMYLSEIETKLGESDVVVGSRYAPGGSHEGLNGSFRVAASKGFTHLTRAMFAEQLMGLKDPMSGYFGVNLRKIDLNTIRASGFKVLLEILLTTPGLTIDEVPVRFRPRFDGESKADWSTGITLLRQLAERRRELSRADFIQKGELQVEGV